MKLFRILVLSAVLVLIASAALAVQPTVKSPTAFSGQVQLNIIDPFNDPLRCIIAYDDRVNPTGFFYSAGAGKEVIDDLHMLTAGALCAFDFGYAKTTAGTTDVTATLYAGNAVDDPPGAILAGPFFFPGLPGGGAFAFHVVTTPINPVVGADIWLGCKFSTASTGLLIYDPPVIGFSDDYFYQLPEAAYFYFGGNPMANFYLSVEVDPATSNRKSTWGSIKTLYR